MSQPHFAEQPDSDPLLAFCEEHEKPPEPPATEKDPVPPDDLRARLERAERQVDRALIDITAVKSDLATLVSAVDDIKKRMSRPPDRPAAVVAMPRRKLSGPKAIATIVLLLMAGAAVWGLMSVATDDAPALPPLEIGSSSAVESPTAAPSPVTDSPRPQPAVTVAAREPPASAAKGAGAARPARQVFVGTLTVDAEPAGDVYLNRKNVGRTPLRLEKLRAGSHLIWIERDGYRRWSRVVAVPAERISRVSASLEPIPR